MGSAQPSERPSQGLCPGRGAKRSQNSPPKDLEKPFKGRCAVADPVSRYSGASGQKKGSARITDAPLVRETDTCRDGLVVINRHVTRYWRAPASRLGGSGATDEHHTNCNTRSPRRFRSCRNRGLPCGNQSEPAGSRRQALSDSQSPYQPKSVPLRVPWRR